MSVNELMQLMNQEVLVRFEQLQVKCLVLNAKGAWGKVRLLVAPVNGLGEQWVELSRVKTECAFYQPAPSEEKSVGTKVNDWRREVQRAL